MKNSWRTTLSGIGVILAALGMSIKMFLAGDQAGALGTLFAGISGGVGLIKARDNVVTSEQAKSE